MSNTNFEEKVLRELSGLGEFKDVVLSELEKINMNFGKLDEKVSKLDGKVGKLDEKVGKLDEKVGKLEKDVSEMKEDISILKSDVKVMDKKISLVDAKVEKIYDRMIDKFEDLEGAINLNQRYINQSFSTFSEQTFTR